MDKPKKVITPEQREKINAGIRAAAAKRKAEKAAKKGTTPESKNEGMVPVSEVEKLLAKQNEQFEKKLADLKTETRAQAIDAKQYASIDRTEIPDDDLLAQPKFYYAWGVALTLSGYVMKGRVVKPPYGRPIKLKRMPPDITFNAAGDRVELEKCGTLDGIWSKKEVEFIENSLQFKGGIIMENVSALNPENAAKQNVRMMAMATVAKMTEPDLIENCRKRHITGVNNDFSAMQTKLIESIYNESVGQVSATQEGIVKRSAEEYAKVN